MGSGTLSSETLMRNRPLGATSVLLAIAGLARSAANDTGLKERHRFADIERITRHRDRHCHERTIRVEVIKLAPV